MSGPRFTPQIKQEQKSRKQIEERLTDFGWLATTPLDLGEDYIVHIYMNGRATGVIFHIQAKSDTDLPKRRQGDNLVYPLKPKDLKHWETFSLPVVLIIWDVERREGRWELLSNIISRLEKERPNWRTNKSKVRVKVPWGNALDDAGLTKLKQVIGQQVYPLIASDKSLEFEVALSFLSNSDGIEMRDAIERHLKEGEPVTIKGRVIRELHFSQWFEQWFGGYDPDAVVLQLGPNALLRNLPARIDVISNTGESASWPNIEFRVPQVGAEFLKLTNDQQLSPLHFNITVRNRETALHWELSLSTKGFGHNANETRDLIRFHQAIATGGSVCLTFLSHSSSPLVLAIDPQPDLAPNAQFVELVEKLCFIQNKLGRLLKIPDKGLSNNDIKAIDELLGIVTYGSTKTENAKLTGEFKSEALILMLNVYRLGKPLHLRWSCDESFVNLFGEKIQTGPMTRDITGYIEMPLPEFEEAVSRLDQEQFLDVRIRATEVIETFQLWSTDFGMANEERKAMNDL